MHPALARRLRGLQPSGTSASGDFSLWDLLHLHPPGLVTQSIISWTPLAPSLLWQTWHTNHEALPRRHSSTPHWELPVASALRPQPCALLIHGHLLRCPVPGRVTPRLRPHSPVLTRLIQPVKTQAPLFSNQLCLSRGPDKKGMSSLEMQNDYSDIGIISPGDHVH